MTMTSKSNTNHRTYQISYRDSDSSEDDPWSLEALLERIQKLLEMNKCSAPNSHKVCLAIAGGGASALSSIAATSGASSILLEGTVTYDRSSYQTYVRKNSSSLSQTSDNSNKKFSYTSMHAAKLASQSALWRGMELQNLKSDYGGNDALLHTIGVGAASTLQTNTAGAKSRTGRPSFGNIVATRGDGQQIRLRFTLNHFASDEIKNPRFAQDCMVSHLILQSLEHFINVNERGDASPTLQQYEVTNADDVDPTDFPGVTVQEWTTNVMAENIETSDDEKMSPTTTNEPVQAAANRILSGHEQAALLLPKNGDDDSSSSTVWTANVMSESTSEIDSEESSPTTNDPVQAAANRILSGREQAVLLLPKNGEDDASNVIPNSFLQPVVYPVLPENALIFPGSFNPPHHGHLALAEAAVEAVQKVSENGSSKPTQPMIVFELSIVNADKPPMEATEVARRVALFRDLLYKENDLSNWGILLTSAPLFADKVQTLRHAAPSGSRETAFSHMQQVEKLPSSKWSFVIGTDTVVRILNPKYYQNDPQQMMQSLRKMDVQFVVGGRLDQSDKESHAFVTGEAELEGLPSDIQDMFLLLQESDFRVDVSSTELRAKAAAAAVSSSDDDENDTNGGNSSSPGKRRGKTALGMNGANKILNVLLAVGVSVLALGLPTCEALPTNQYLSTRAGERIHETKLFDSFALENPSAVTSFIDTNPLDFSHRYLKDKEKKEEETEDKKAEESTASGEEVCTSVAKCEQCTFSDQKTYEACKETGRWEKFECKKSGDDETSVRTEMRSCKYTEADEEFAMIRLQMMCFLIGSIAIASVRKQKRVSASLFDQRKQGVAPGASQNGAPNKKMSCVITPNDDEEIEFTPMTNQEGEMVPLTKISEDDLEVV